MRIAQGERNVSFERLFATAFDSRTTSIRVSDIRLHDRTSVLNFVRFCDAVVALCAPSAERRVKLELVASFEHCDDATRRTLVSALLELARSLEKSVPLQCARLLLNRLSFLSLS